MTQLFDNGPASTALNQREYRTKTQAYLLKGKLTPAEILLLEIERRRLKLSPAQAGEIEAEVKRSICQAKATRLGVLSVFLLGLGTIPFLLQTPSRQALSLTAQSESSAIAPIETFMRQEQGTETLAKARQIAQSGDFDVAIAIATQISSNSLLYPEVQIQILQWQQQKRQAQNTAFKRIE